MEQYLVSKAPSKIYYIPNFISSKEESLLLEQVIYSPQPKWEYLKNRRLQNWGGIIGKKALIPDGDIPSWLQSIMDKVASLSDTFPPEFLPNHVLINEYTAGQGIMPHTDGPLFYPVVTTVSLGSHTFLDFYNSISLNSSTTETENINDRFVGTVLLEPRSLIVIKESAYNIMHGIKECYHDVIHDKIFNNENSDYKIGQCLSRTNRMSLTIRNVPKVAKLGVKELLQKP